MHAGENLVQLVACGLLLLSGNMLCCAVLCCCCVSVICQRVSWIELLVSTVCQVVGVTVVLCARGGWAWCWSAVTLQSVCVCLYVCVCMCVYVCMCMCIYMRVCMYICMYLCMVLCMFVCMYVCTRMYACMYICMYACMYVYMYMCVYVCVYRVSQEERTKLREGVPYVELYRYNP